MSLENLLTGLITGDAAGRPLEGMSREHIKNSFKNLAGYPDNEAALKNRKERWKKPGLYSSISQFAIINALSFINGHHDRRKYQSISGRAAELHFSDSGLFRDTDRCESYFLKEYTRPGYRPPPRPSVRIIPSALPLSLMTEDPLMLTTRTIELTTRFTTEYDTVAASSLLNLTVRLLADAPENGIMSAAISSAHFLKKTIEDTPEIVFENSLNPDSFLESVLVYVKILEKIVPVKNYHEAENAICSFLNNRDRKVFIKRATVENPAALVPFLLHFSSLNDDKIDTGTLISGITGLGGKSSVSGAVGGAISAVLNGVNDPLLVNGLINKTRINSVADSLVRGKVNDSLIEEFLLNEKKMTEKEETEISSKLKHGRKGQQKKPKERNEITDRIENLNRHVVESWTKDDRARWKKTGKKTISNKNI